MTSVRILCYNVRSLRDDVDALVRVIRSVAPDVLIVQEAPRFLRWRSKCAALARRSGLVVVAGGRVTGANVVFSTLACDVLDVREVAFSPYRNLHRRGAVMALLRKGDATFAVAGTHLDLIEVPRLTHLEELRHAALGIVPPEAPFVLAGDFNAVLGSATWSKAAEFGADAWAESGEGDGFTYPSRAAERRIDGVFVSRATVTRIATIDSPDVHIASDHRPIVVELDL